MAAGLETFPWILVLLGLPLLGALVLITLPKIGVHTAKNAKHVALWTHGAVFIYTLWLAYLFDHKTGDVQFVDHLLPSLMGQGFQLGIDGISLVLVLLTSFLFVVTSLASWKSVKEGIKGYAAAFLVLETCVLGVFVAWDLLLFFVFFEALLIPMFFIVGLWGGERRHYAAFKFFLYTLAGSLLMLVALLYMYSCVGSFNFDVVGSYLFNMEQQRWLALTFLIAFGIKMPMWPVHTWLPDTHVEAPTGGSVILAGILLKLGGYGLLRLVLPLFPQGVVWLQPLVFALSAVAIVYASFVAFAQQDIKKLVAYSSIAHMGIVTMGLFAMGEQGIQGALFQMVSHGLVSGGLFLVIGMIYERLHTRDINVFGGLVEEMPVYAILFMVLTLGSLGLPGTTGFVGELLVLLRVFSLSPWMATVAATGAIWSALYSLWLYRKMIWEERAVKEKVRVLSDLSARERLELVPIVLLVVFLGICPDVLLRVTQPAVEQNMRQTKAARLSDGMRRSQTKGETTA